MDCCDNIHEIHEKPQDKATAALRILPHPSQEAKTFVASLQLVTDLTITWSCCSSHKPFCDAYRDLLSLGWLTFGSQLRSLSLTTTVDSIPSLFGSPFQLPKLEQLDLDILKDESTTDTAVYSILIPFIQRHVDYLGDLRIRIYPQDNHSKFYNALGHFPNLQKFTFTGSYGDRNLAERATALSKFLSLHSATITHFNWDLAVGYQSPPLSVRLPMLKALKIVFSVYGRYGTHEFQDVLQYLTRQTQPLSSLSVLNARLLPFEIRNLLSIRTVSHLRDLELSLTVLDYSTFSAIVPALPNLERFVAIFNRFNLRSVEFSDGNLRDWSVSDVVLQLQEPSLNFLDMWGKLILESFPRIEYLNGMYREDILKSILRRR